MINLDDIYNKIRVEEIEHEKKIKKIGNSINFELISSETLKNKEIPKKIANDYNLYIENVKQMEYFIGTFKVNLQPQQLFLSKDNITLKEFKGTKVKGLYNKLYEKVKEIIPKLQEDLLF